MLTIPEWEECEKKVKSGSFTALELFVHNNEPAGEEELKQWRVELYYVMKELMSLN